MVEDRTSSASSIEIQMAAPAADPIHHVPSSALICVLLVEDDQVLRAVSADTLSDLGYRTIRAANGIQALAALEREPNIKVLMTDIGLPGMDGQQLAAETRRRWPGIGILFVTGYDEMLTDAHLVREGGFEYLAKPYGYEDLAKVLKRLLGWGINES